MLHLRDTIRPGCNVLVRSYDRAQLPAGLLQGDGRLLDRGLRACGCLERRETHNVLTNVGRAWLRDLVGATSYASIDAGSGYIEGAGNVITSKRVAYMAYGVGGALQTDTRFYRTQEELVTVTALEDYVAVLDTPTYLKTVLPQTVANDAFPDAFTIRFSAILATSEVSFDDGGTFNQSKSGVEVKTEVPVSEVGLYTSGADPTADLDAAANTTNLVAYNIFAPITVTPRVVLRVDWDFLF